MIENSKITIITVTYNNAKGLEKTIKSVIDQTYNNIEFIIVDGNSNDNTFNLVKKYEKNIDKYIREPDKGIYDAMNKGISLATGQWINFMNAGDTFAYNDVLRQLEIWKHKDIALLYGNKVYKDNVIYPQNIKKLENGEIMACHQAMFFNYHILKNELFYKIKLEIYADYELVNRIYLKKFPLKYIDLNIVDFEGGGISSLPSFQKRKDKYHTLLKAYGIKKVFKVLIDRAGL